MAWIAWPSTQDVFVEPEYSDGFGLDGLYGGRVHIGEGEKRSTKIDF